MHAPDLELQRWPCHSSATGNTLWKDLTSAGLWRSACLVATDEWFPRSSGMSFQDTAEHKS